MIKKAGWMPCFFCVQSKKCLPVIKWCATNYPNIEDDALLRIHSVGVSMKYFAGLCGYHSAILILLINSIAGSLFAATVHAQAEDRNDSLMIGGKQYLLELSGSVHNERFNRVLAVLSVTYSKQKTGPPLVVMISSYPHSGARNSFMWNSMYSSIVRSYNTVRCSLKKSLASNCEPGIDFHYLSPKLLRLRLGEKPLTHREKEDRLLDERTVLPTKVVAQHGELELSFDETSVKGNVELSGYDPIEQSYVRYFANITGRITRDTEQRQHIPYEK